MKDVVAVLQQFAGADLTPLIRALEDAPTVGRNKLLGEYIRRIRVAAGIPPRPAPGRGALLLALDAEAEP